MRKLKYNMEALVWLNASLFCKRNNWSALFKDGIDPFVKKSMEQKTINAYSIELSSFEGDHVRFAILLEKCNVPLLGETMNLHFKKFFEYAGFESPDISLPVNRLFLPFPCNSIRYGLYNVDTHPQDRVLIDIQRELSDVISLALSEETADEELLITLGFYLQSMWLTRKKRSAMFDGHNGISGSYYPINHETPEGKLVRRQIHKRYLLTRKMLEEIYQVVGKVDDQSCSDCPAWLRQWSMACDCYLRNVPYNNNEIPALISRHLGLTPIMNFMVLYFLKQTVDNETINFLVCKDT